MHKSVGGEANTKIKDKKKGRWLMMDDFHTIQIPENRATL